MKIKIKNIIDAISKNNNGFTLIEILIVFIIIGILLSIVGLNLTGKTTEARRLAARATIKQFETALKMFYQDNGFYPSAEQGLKALVEKPAAGKIPKTYPAGGYLEAKKTPKDPWGNDYIYLYPGVHNAHSFDILSFGADGQISGTDDNEDITNWEEESNNNK